MIVNEPQGAGPREWTRTVLGDWIRGGWRIRRAPSFRLEHGRVVVVFWLYRHGGRWTATGRFADAPNFRSVRSAQQYVDALERAEQSQRG